MPVAQSRRLHDLLDRAGVKNQLIMVDMAGHDGPLFSTPEVQPKVINFINEALGKSRGQMVKTTAIPRANDLVSHLRCASHLVP